MKDFRSFAVLALWSFCAAALPVAAAPGAMDPNQILKQPESGIFDVASNPAGGLDMVSVGADGSTLLLSHYDPYAGAWEISQVLDDRPAAVANPQLVYLPSGQGVVMWEEGGEVAVMMLSGGGIHFVSPMGVAASGAELHLQSSDFLSNLGIQVPDLGVAPGDLVVFYRWDGTLATDPAKETSYTVPVYGKDPVSGVPVLLRQVTVQSREDIPSWRVPPSSSRAVQTREDVPAWGANGAASANGNGKGKNPPLWQTVSLRVLVVAAWEGGEFSGLASRLPVAGAPDGVSLTDSPPKIVAVGIREDIPSW
jgi:hypothetical protein